MLNVPLLRKTMEHIEENLADWAQNQWVGTARRWVNTSNEIPEVKRHGEHVYQREEFTVTCGTTFCFAGHAAHLAGWSPVWLEDLKRFSDRMMEKDGVERETEFIAMEELGLSIQEAGALFHGSNSLTRLRLQVDRLIGSER